MSTDRPQGLLAQTQPKKRERQGYATIEGRDPRDGLTWDLMIAHDKMDWVASGGMGKALELAHTVRHTLMYPRAIFQGVREYSQEMDDDHWLCYCGTPACAYDHKTGNKVACWEDEVFLVFITDEAIVYTWYWSDCDSSQSHLPVDYATRFDDQIF